MSGPYQRARARLSIRSGLAAAKARSRSITVQVWSRSALARIGELDGDQMRNREQCGEGAGLRFVVLDELHSLVTSKRGHLLSLGLARLRTFRPDLRAIGLSATVAEPDELRRWLAGQNPHFFVATPTPNPSPLRGGELRDVATNYRRCRF